MSSAQPDESIPQPIAPEVYERVEGNINRITVEEFTQMKALFEQTNEFTASSGETVSYIDMPGQTVEHADPTPILMIPGWAHTATTFMVPINGFTQLGSRVLSVQSPYYGTAKAMNDTPSGIQPSQSQKAQMYIELLDQQNIKPVDVVAVSEGAITATAIAKARPDLIRNVVMVNPAGMTGDSSFRMVRRYGAQAAAIKKKERGQQGSADGWNHEVSYLMKREGGKQSNRYMLTNPYRALRGGAAIAKTNLAPNIATVGKETDSKIAMLLGRNDLLFPLAEDIAGLSKTTGIPEERIQVIEGSHLMHLDNPGRWTVAAGRQLEAMRLAT